MNDSSSVMSSLWDEDSTDVSTQAIKIARAREWPWWWWEIGGSLISLLAFASTIVFLSFIDGKARANITYQIEPNTLLALLTTVTKTAMMVPVVACISQLKWHSFASGPRRLSHLDLMDRCSRGPWGSFMLLLELPRVDLVIAALAVVTIAGLGIDPSVQQILDSGIRRIEATNETFTLSTATDYESASLGPGLAISPQLVELYRLLNVGYMHGSMPLSECPGVECFAAAHTSLGVCTEFKDLTQETDHNCSDVMEDIAGGMLIDCRYTMPEDKSWTSDETDSPIVPLTWQFKNGSLSSGVAPRDETRPLGWIRSGWSQKNLLLKARTEVRDHRETPHAKFDILAVNEDWLHGQTSFTLPPVIHAYRVRFYYCAQSFTGWTSTEYLPEDTIGASERLYKVADGGSTDAEENPSPVALEARSIGMKFRLHDSPVLIFEFLSVWFHDALAELSTKTSQYRQVNGLGRQSFTGADLYLQGLEKAFQNLAWSLSTILIQAGPEVGGDNLKATKIQGKVYIDELYYRVRWPWIVVVLLEVILVAVLLIMTIYINRNEDLPKDSTFALLLHGLHGWDNLRAPNPETVRSLERMAKEMTGKLEETSDGVKKFVKQL